MNAVLYYHDKLFSYEHIRYEEPDMRNYFCHMHNDYEIFYFLDGDAEYMISGKTYRLSTNDLLIIKPSAYHMLCLLSNAPFERIIFNFHEEVLPENLIKILRNAHPVFPVEKDSVVYNIFQNLILTEGELDEEDMDFYTLNSLKSLVVNLKYLKPAQNDRAASSNNIFEDILKYIHANLTESLNIKEIADRFFVSVSWIEHAFNKYLNIGVRQYINQKKILYAQTLILSGESISEVAERLGYKNYPTFWRQYKAFLNTEPIQDKMRGQKTKRAS